MWTDGGEQVIEKGGHVRLKFMGLRSEPGKMFAVGDINFDYLGCVKDTDLAAYSTDTL
jgi:DNA-directed RNA polymerase II subunit RPB7